MAEAMDGAAYEQRAIEAILGIADRLVAAGRREASPAPLHVPLTGEPGSGRTTVLSQVGERLLAAGFRIVPVTAYPGRGSCRRTLADVGRELTSGGDGAVVDGMESLLKDALRGWDRNQALLLGPPVPAIPEELRRFLGDRFEGSPVALLLDDGHHADELTIRLLDTLLGSMGSGPHLVVEVTDGSRPHLIADEPWEVEPVRIEPLSERELEDLLSRMGVDGSRVAAGAATLHGSWHRVPRAARLLADELAAEGEGSRAIAILGRQGIRALKRERLLRLPEGERDLLEVASVSKSGINLWRMRWLGVSTDREVVAVTSELERRGILRASFPGGRLRLIFRDGDDRALVYGAIEESKRRYLHMRFADLVRDDDIDIEDRLSEIGRHLVLSGDEIAGAASLLEAGRLLLRKGRVDEARRHFQEVERRGRRARALEGERLLAEEGIADVDRRTGAVDSAIHVYDRILEEGARLLDPTDRVRIMIRLARLRLAAGLVDQADEMLARAREVVDVHAGEVGRLHLLEASLADRRGDTLTADAARARARALAIEEKSEPLMASVNQSQAGQLLARGAVLEALQSLEAAHQSFEKLGDPTGYAINCNMMGTAFSTLGRVDEAEACYRATFEVNKRLRNLPGMAVALNNLATVQIGADRFEDAEATLRECLRIQRRREQGETPTVAQLNLAAVADSTGRHREALGVARDLHALALASQNQLVRVGAMLTIVDALTSLGELREALDLVDELSDLTRRFAMRLLTRAVLSRCRLLRIVGDLDACLGELADGLRLSQEQDCVPEARLFLAELADIHLDEGRLDDAGARLAAVGRLPASPSGLERARIELLELDLGWRSEPDGGAGQIQRIEELAQSGSATIMTQAARILVRALPPDRALPYALARYEIHREREEKEELAAAARDLGEIEQRLGLPAAAAHLDEAARTILSIAADLPDDRRATYLGSYGRRKVLLYARGLE